MGKVRPRNINDKPVAGWGLCLNAVGAQRGAAPDEVDGRYRRLWLRVVWLEEGRPCCGRSGARLGRMLAAQAQGESHLQGQRFVYAGRWLLIERRFGVCSCCQVVGQRVAGYGRLQCQEHHKKPSDNLVCKIIFFHVVNHKDRQTPC